MKSEGDEEYQLRVKVKFIIVASLRVLCSDIRKVFDDLLSINEKKTYYQYCDI
jgi:hypothetical protein